MNELEKKDKQPNNEIDDFVRNLRNSINFFKEDHNFNDQTKKQIEIMENSLDELEKKYTEAVNKNTESAETIKILESIIEASPTPTILKKIMPDENWYPQEEILLICNKAEWDLLKIPENARKEYLANINHPIDMKRFRENFGYIIEKVKNTSKLNPNYSWADLDRDETVTLSLDSIHRDGTRYFLKTNIRKLKNDLFVIFHQDISIEKGLEADINLLIEHIIKIQDDLSLSENNISVLKKNLLEGEKIIEKLEENIYDKQKIVNWFEQNIRTVAHDIKSPFSGIFGYIEILEDPELTEEEKNQFFQALSSAIKKTYKVINDLIQVIVSRKMETIIKQEKISDIIHEKVELYTPNANNKNIKLHVNIAENAEYAFFDSDDFKTIIQNLLDNAIKFTKQDGTVEISTENADDLLKLIIQDNGIGMTEDKIRELLNQSNEKLLEFKKTETRGTAGEKGTGLGLKFCISLIRRNQCELEIESSKEKGTKFIISIPNTK